MPLSRGFAGRDRLVRAPRLDRLGVVFPAVGVGQDRLGLRPRVGAARSALLGQQPGGALLDSIIGHE